MGASQPMPNTLRERLEPCGFYLQLVLRDALLPSLRGFVHLGLPQVILPSPWLRSAANAMILYDANDHSLRSCEVRRVPLHAQHRHFFGIFAFLCEQPPMRFARLPNTWPYLQCIPHFLLLQQVDATTTNIQVYLVCKATDIGATIFAFACAFGSRGTGSGCAIRRSRHG